MAREDGFTLLEVLAAVAVFAWIFAIARSKLVLPFA